MRPITAINIQIGKKISVWKNYIPDTYLFSNYLAKAKQVFTNQRTTS